MDGELNIAGELSHPSQLPKTPVHYINLLSRFKPIESVQKFDYCVLLSGPEPQRTVFENIIVESIKKMHGTILLVRGKPLEKTIPFVADNITVYNHLKVDELSKAIQESKFILCRSGYSTIMDLLILKKKMILVPTPGQTEQEYLARLLMQKNLAISVKQTDFNLDEILEKAKIFKFKQREVKAFDAQELINLLNF